MNETNISESSQDNAESLNLEEESEDEYEEKEEPTEITSTAGRPIKRLNYKDYSYKGQQLAQEGITS